MLDVKRDADTLQSLFDAHLRLRLLIEQLSEREDELLAELVHAIAALERCELPAVIEDGVARAADRID